ncbi:MAG: YHS domain-containing protein [Chloroflexi bacterium]|nr:YHS domain-containing protein [Chloroflexota bacterium]
MNGKTDPRFQIDVGSYTDPVCKMAVEREKAFHFSWNGVDYYFCAKGCRDEFANDVEKYLAGKESSF